MKKSPRMYTSLVYTEGVARSFIVKAVSVVEAVEKIEQFCFEKYNDHEISHVSVHNGEIIND